MNDNDYDEDGNNTVPCPICMSNYCPGKEDGKCPEEEEFVKALSTKEVCLEGAECKGTCEEWEKEFDRNFITPDKAIYYHGEDSNGAGGRINLKSFIHSLLATERTKAKEEGRQEERERVMKEFKICEPCFKNDQHNWNLCKCVCDTCPTGRKRQRDLLTALTPTK